MRATIFDLVSDTAIQARGVASSIGRLAIAEVGGSVGSLLKAVVCFVFGIGTALIGILFLLHGAVYLLVSYGWSEAAAYGIVGGTAALLSLLAFITGYLFSRSASPIPYRAVREVKALFTQKNDPS